MSENQILVRTFKLQDTTHQFAAVAWFYDLWAWLTENKAVQHALTIAHVHDNSCRHWQAVFRDCKAESQWAKRGN